MATEIEKKYRLVRGQNVAVARELARLGAEYAGEDVEENILFLGDGFIETNTVLRLRRIGSRTILTFKRRAESAGGAKHHIEHETTVGDFDETATILELLGYRRSMVYEKRRRTWRVAGAEVVLDELPFGEFIEIEGTLDQISAAEKLVGATEFETEHLTYPALVLLHGRRTGEVIESRFAEK